LIQAGDSQFEFDYGGIPAKYENTTEINEILTTTSKKIFEKYNNLSTAFVTDETDTSIEPYFTQTELDLSASANSESTFDYKTDITTESEKTRIKENIFEGIDVETSSSSSQTLNEVTTVSQDDEDNSDQKKENVLLASEVTKIAIPLKPENITDLEDNFISLTLHETQVDYSNQLHEEYETAVEENYLDLNEDSRNIAEIEIEADKLLSDFEESLIAEDEKIEKSTNPFVNVQNKETRS